MAETTLRDEAAHAANLTEFAGLQNELERLEEQAANILGRVDAFAVRLPKDPLATTAHADEVQMLRKAVDDTRLAARDAKKIKPPKVG